MKDRYPPKKVSLSCRAICADAHEYLYLDVCDSADVDLTGTPEIVPIGGDRYSVISCGEVLAANLPYDEALVFVHGNSPL